MTRFLAPFVCALFLAALMPTASAEPLARVNDREITEAELQHYITRFALQQRLDPEALRRSPQFPQVRAGVLEQLIRRELLWQAARQSHRAGDQEVAAAMARTQRQLGGAERLERALRHQGIDREELRRQLRQELSIQRYLQDRVYPGTEVSEAEVTSYYEANRAQFHSPDLLHLRLLRVAGAGAESRERAAVLRDRLAAGAAAHDLAGDGVESADLGFVNAQDLGAELERVADALKPGEISEPVAGPDAVYVLQLLERRSGIQAPLSAVAERIRERLLRERREQALEKHLEDLASDARIERP